MKIVRGLNYGGLRIVLTFESEDVDTHSVMSGNQPQFEELATEVRNFAADMMQSMSMSEGRHKQ